MERKGGRKKREELNLKQRSMVASWKEGRELEEGLQTESGPRGVGLIPPN